MNVKGQFPSQMDNPLLFSTKKERKKEREREREREREGGREGRREGGRKEGRKEGRGKKDFYQTGLKGYYKACSC